MDLQKRPAPDNNGASASTQRLQNAEQNDSHAKRAQRPLLAGLGPASPGASSPEAQCHKGLKLETQRGDHSSLQSPASAAKHAQRPPPQPPDPSLGGVSIQRCGQLRYHKASAGSDSTQHSSPQSPHQHAEAAAQPESVRRFGNAEQRQRQHAGESSQGIPSTSSHADSDRQGTLTLQWRVKMKECVDASPLILMQRHMVDGQLTPR